MPLMNNLKISQTNTEPICGCVPTRVFHWSPTHSTEAVFSFYFNGIFPPSLYLYIWSVKTGMGVNK